MQHFALVGSVRVSFKSTMNETCPHFARKTRKSLARQRVELYVHSRVILRDLFRIGGRFHHYDSLAFFITAA